MLRSVLHSICKSPIIMIAHSVPLYFMSSEYHVKVSSCLALKSKINGCNKNESGLIQEQPDIHSKMLKQISLSKLKCVYLTNA